MSTAADLCSPSASILPRAPHVTPVTLLAATAMLIVSGAVLLTDGQVLSVLAFAS